MRLPAARRVFPDAEERQVVGWACDVLPALAIAGAGPACGALAMANQVIAIVRGDQGHDEVVAAVDERVHPGDGVREVPEAAEQGTKVRLRIMTDFQ